VFADQSFSQLVTNPLAQAYLRDVGIGLSTGIGLPFCVVAVALLIETHILFSLWASFLVFQLWNLLGWRQLQPETGLPWRHQQGIGAFVAYAGLAIFVARRYLKEIGLRVLGLGKADPDSLIAREVWTYRLALICLATRWPSWRCGGSGPRWG